MKAKSASRTVRCSLALPRAVAQKATALAPNELRGNLNRLVRVALEEFAASREARAFEEAMACMAADPAVRKECASIERDFGPTEADGLRDD